MQSKTSPHQRQVEAVPSDHGSCVCGPNCFLITLCSRQDKIVSLEKHVCGVRVSLEEFRPGGNPEQGVRLQNSLPPWGPGKGEQGEEAGVLQARLPGSCRRIPKN